jgi:Xaa-Pro aminopeptidase
VAHEARLEQARRAVAAGGGVALLVSPGADLRYLVGHPAPPQERLTCLVLPAAGSAHLVVPSLDRDAAAVSARDLGGVEVRSWREDEDPVALVASLLPPSGTIVVDDHMWAAHVLALAAAIHGRELRAAGHVLGALRARKSPAELAALREAAAAVDAVFTGMPGRLRPGRSELEVAAETRAAMLAAGHALAGYVIVASGPNAALPHHEPGERILQDGDAVVVDLAGMMPSGYWSDCTRTFVLGRPEPGLAAAYAVLADAQQAAVAAVRAGVPAATVDAAAREPITAAGYGALFVHRTGHGIGLDVHEEPFIAAGNDAALEAGSAFSVEPGIYLPGRFGARLEDIVVCHPEGAERLNHAPRGLIVVDT